MDQTGSSLRTEEDFEEEDEAEDEEDSDSYEESEDASKSAQSRAAKPRASESIEHNENNFPSQKREIISPTPLNGEGTPCS